MKTDVLLTYGWVRSTYAALKNLAFHNLKVVVSDTNNIGMCQWSKYAYSFFKYESPFRDERKFIDSLKLIIEKCSPRLLLPSHEEILIIAKYIKEFPENVIIPISSYEKLELANDKYKSQKFAENIGINVPKQIEYQDLKHLKQLLIENKNICRWVVKLRRSNSAKGVFYPKNNNEVIELVKWVISKYNLSDNRKPLVQEFVDGNGWGVSCLYYHGELIASFTHKRLREKIQTGGTSTFREHKPNAVIEEMAYKLLASLKWHGLAMVEFKFNQKDNKAWFIEINPRLWGSIHLAIEAGVEFPYLLYLAEVNSIESAKKYISQKKVKYPFTARWYLGDCILAISNLLKGKIFNALKLILPGKADTYDDFDIKDIKAFLGEIFYYLFTFLKKRKINPEEDGMLG